MNLPHDFVSKYINYLTEALLQLFPDNQIEILPHEEKHKRDGTLIKVLSAKETDVHEKLANTAFSFSQKTKGGCLISFLGDSNFPALEIEQYNLVTVLEDLDITHRWLHDKLIEGLEDAAPINEEIDRVAARMAEIQNQLALSPDFA